MPPKKKVFASSRPSAQGHIGQRKNITEVIADSDEEFEHLTVEAEDRYVFFCFPYFSVLMYLYFLDRVDKEEAIEISDIETEVKYDELALIPSSSGTGLPSTPSPIKALLVLFHFVILIIFYT
jgi:hypothetical protein